MRITFDIVDSKVQNFSQEATNTLKKVSKEYANFIIEEAKRIEQADRSGDAQAEVIASHIDEAKKNYRRAPAKKTWMIIVSVICDLLILLVGAMFDKQRILSDNTYMIIYIVLVIATVVFLIVKYAKGGAV